MLLLKGAGMGAADVIPGVSGGTIAFITGIYQELIHSIKSIDLSLFRLLMQQGFAAAWRKANGGFLLAVFSGILLSIFSLARLMSWLILHYQMLVWAFFFGLILGSAIFLFRRSDRWNTAGWASLFAGIIIAWLITRASPSTTPEYLWFIALSGMIAISAMILPGISGSFILLLLGKYEYMMRAVSELQIVTLIVFALGCLIGLMSFSRVISWLFKRFPQMTMALLTGFMLGSLNKLWPWKEILTHRINRAGELVPLLEKNIGPGRWAELQQAEPMVWAVILCALAGLGLVLFFELAIPSGEKTAETK